MEKLLQAAMKNVIENGTLETMIEDQLKISVKKLVEDCFRWNGVGAKAIEDQLGSLMTKVIEGHDFDSYVVKLDSVLTDLTKELTGDYRELISNFKDYTEVQFEKETKLSDLSQKYFDYIKSQSRDNYEFDDFGYESYLECRVFDQEKDVPSWSKHDHTTIYFENDHNEDYNFELKLWRIDNNTDEWYINTISVDQLSSLKHMNKFELHLRALSTANTKLTIDEEHIQEDVHMYID